MTNSPVLDLHRKILGSAKFTLFSCSFSRKYCKILGWCPTPFKVGTTLLEFLDQLLNYTHLSRRDQLPKLASFFYLCLVVFTGGCGGGGGGKLTSILPNTGKSILLPFDHEYRYNGLPMWKTVEYPEVTIQKIRNKNKTKIIIIYFFSFAIITSHVLHSLQCYLFEKKGLQKKRKLCNIIQHGYYLYHL